MKRKTAILMAAFMTATCLPATGYAATFSDINDVPWDGAKTYIQSVADSGLMVGDLDAKTGKKQFRARDKVTYTEATQLAYMVLKQTNKLNSSSENLSTKWSHVMKSYNVADWSYECIAYALENEVISLADLARFRTKTNNKVTDNYATRESVAVIYGKMLRSVYPVNNSAALAFADKSDVASTSVPYVELLSRLNILVGDENNNFKPRAYINRAEMAVVTSKAYDTTGKTTPSAPDSAEKTVQGTVLSVDIAGSSRLLSVQTETGSRQGFVLTASTTVYQGTGTTLLSIGSVDIGDTVSVTYSGAEVKTVRLLQDANPISGTVVGVIDSVDNQSVSVKKNSDGNINAYSFGIVYTISIDGKTASQKDLVEAVLDKTVKVTLTLNSAGAVTDIQATTEAAEGITGILVAISDDEVSYKKSSGGSTIDYEWLDDPVVYLEGKSSTVKKVRDALKEDTIYVKFHMDSKDRVKKLYASEEKFTSSSTDTESTGTVKKLSSSEIQLRISGYNTNETYKFASSVDYYLDGEESTYKKISSAYDKAENDDDTFYAKVELDSSGKVKRLYTSKDRDELTDISSTRSRDGEVLRISSDSIRLDEDGTNRNYTITDDTVFYLEAKRSTYSKVRDAFSDAEDNKDTFYATVYLNSSDKATRIEASEKGSSSGREYTDTIRSLSKSSIKLGSKTYDLNSDARIELEDETIKLNDLIAMVDDRDITLEATITVKSNEVTKLYAVYDTVEGELIDIYRTTVEVETDDDTHQFTLSSSVSYTGDYSSQSKLISALNDGKDIDVMLTFTDGKVSKVNSRR